MKYRTLSEITNYVLDNPAVRLEIYQKVLDTLTSSLMSRRQGNHGYAAFLCFSKAAFLCFRLEECDHEIMRIFSANGYKFRGRRLDPELEDTSSVVEITYMFPEIIRPNIPSHESSWGTLYDYELRIGIINNAIKLVKEKL